MNKEAFLIMPLSAVLAKVMLMILITTMFLLITIKKI